MQARTVWRLGSSWRLAQRPAYKVNVKDWLAILLTSSSPARTGGWSRRRRQRAGVAAGSWAAPARRRREAPRRRCRAWRRPRCMRARRAPSRTQRSSPAAAAAPPPSRLSAAGTAPRSCEFNKGVQSIRIREVNGFKEIQSFSAPSSVVGSTAPCSCA